MFPKQYQCQKRTNATKKLGFGGFLPTGNGLRFFFPSHLIKQKLSLFLNTAKQLASNRATNMAEYRTSEL